MSKGFRNRAFRAYQKVKTLKPARSLFDESHDVLATMDMGKCYPTCLMEMSPGDTFHIWQESVVRMQPLNAPILHDIFLFTHYFFVPYRILWEEWVAFITGDVEGDKGGQSRSDDDFPDNVTPELPRWRPSNGKNVVGSLWDYCGFPTDVIPEGALPLDFVRRCYNRIWNEYYRDETLQEEVDEANEDILFRNWKKDYFTSALVSQQRGVSPAMPLSGSVISSSSRYTSNNTSMHPSNVNYNNETGACSFDFYFSIPKTALPDVNPGNVTQLIPLFSDNVVTFTSTITHETVDSKSFSVSSCRYSYESENNYVWKGNATATMITGIAAFFEASARSDITFDYSHFNLENVGSFDVKDLRVAFQIQRWLELANRGGVRYTEFLRSFFGVSPRDDRLQRPEYIGGSKSPIVISEVLQTSSTASEPTPQGNMAGHGVGASRTYIGSYTAVEFGMVMAITSIMPSAKYMQGINRQWLRRTKYDFLFPQFTGLSEQAIEQAEIYAENTEAKNRKVWGFNEVYDELRSMPSRIVGKMRTVFDYWHLGRKFNSAPSLNSEFIKCNPSKRIFAVPSEDGFIVNIANIIRAVRPIPKYGTPKGV